MSLIKSQLINPDYVINNNELRNIQNKVNKNLLKYKQELISVEQTLEPLQLSKFKKLVVEFIIELNQKTKYFSLRPNYDSEKFRGYIADMIKYYNQLSRFIITTFNFNKISSNNKDFINYTLVNTHVLTLSNVLIIALI